MSSNEIQTNDVNGFRLAEQGPSSGRCSRQGNIGRHHANPVISKRRKWTSQENKIVMECYLLSEPKIRGYRKLMLSLWHQKGMFWVSEQRLVDRANTICRNSWMTELEIEELERKVTGSGSVLAAEARSSEALPDQVREDKSQGDSLCRMCRKVDESIDHIVSGCSKLAQKEYKRRYDNLGKIVHWKLARKCNFEAGDKWYEHEPESVLENKDYRILWDFSIQTDHVIEARRPDLVVVHKKKRNCKIIDFAVPGDSRIEEKEKDKIEKYQELGRELQKMWNVKVKIIPLVVGSLGAIPKQFGNRLKQIGIAVGTAQVQKTVLLGTARILRKVLEI